MYSEPVAYFITFTTYGTRLHGDPRGSIFEYEGIKQLIGENKKLHDYKSGLMKYPEVNLEKQQRKIVFETLLEHCRIKNWHLFAAHVRSNHVHLLIRSEIHPDKMMNEIKSWSTRKLREAGHTFERIWTKHGSTIFIFSFENLRKKIRYVILEQGEMMEYYIDERFAGMLK